MFLDFFPHAFSPGEGGVCFLEFSTTTIKKATMQGGFLGYDLHFYNCQKINEAGIVRQSSRILMFIVK
jgi:hypothetical protein